MRQKQRASRPATGGKGNACGGQGRKIDLSPPALKGAFFLSFGKKKERSKERKPPEAGGGPNRPPHPLVCSTSSRLLKPAKMNARLKKRVCGLVYFIKAGFNANCLSVFLPTKTEANKNTGFDLLRKDCVSVLHLSIAKVYLVMHTVAFKCGTHEKEKEIYLRKDCACLARRNRI